jgi:pyruvate dehydrogenase E1 component
VDRDLMLSYKESEIGQILHEGHRRGRFGGVLHRGRTPATTQGERDDPGLHLISMFGFQRTGDRILGRRGPDDARRIHSWARTAGRTTLNGEGLAAPGWALPAAGVRQIPAWSPTTRPSGYEIGHIVKDGLRRMTGESADVFYYLTVFNEPYPQPAEALGRGRRGHPARHAPGRASGDGADPSASGAPCVQLLASGVGVELGPARP